MLAYRSCSDHDKKYANSKTGLTITDCQWQKVLPVQLHGDSHVIQAQRYIPPWET